LYLAPFEAEAMPHNIYIARDVIKPDIQPTSLVYGGFKPATAIFLTDSEQQRILHIIEPITIYI